MFGSMLVYMNLQVLNYTFPEYENGLLAICAPLVWSLRGCHEKQGTLAKTVVARGRESLSAFMLSGIVLRTRMCCGLKVVEWLLVGATYIA